MKHLDEAQREALAEGAPDAASEVVAHHAECPVCQAAVRDAAGRRKLLQGLTPYTLSDMAFRRVEARLAEQVEAGLPERWPRLVWLLPVGLAVVAVAMVAVSQLSRPSAPEVVALPTKPTRAAEAPFHPLTVLQAAADAQRSSLAPWGEGEGSGEDSRRPSWKPLTVGEVLAAGDRVSSSGLTVVPLEGKWAFAGQGSWSLGGPATVSLGAGVVTAKVSEPAVVAAGTRQIWATEALFQVSRAAAEVVLAVVQGSVEVTDSVSQERRRVTAPATVRWADGAPLSSGREEPMGEVIAPYAPPSPWVRFDASGLPAGTSISLDGAKLGTAPLVSLVGLGRHRLALAAPGRPTVESWIDLVGSAPFAAVLPELEGPAPSADALARVQQDLLRHRPKLAACYEKWLKANRAASGTVELTLVVAASGKVKAARVSGGDALPASSAECLVRTARGLVLSPLGAEAELEVPLVFTAGGR